MLWCWLLLLLGSVTWGAAGGVCCGRGALCPPSLARAHASLTASALLCLPVLPLPPVDSCQVDSNLLTQKELADLARVRNYYLLLLPCVHPVALLVFHPLFVNPLPCRWCLCFRHHWLNVQSQCL